MTALNLVIRSFIIITLLLTFMVLPTSARYDDLDENKVHVFVDDEETNQETIDSFQQTANNSWPQVQYDANRSGYVPQTVGPPFTELWRIGKYAPNETDSMFPVSSRVQPIIAENLIFMPSNDNSLYALRTSNGQQAWSYTSQGPLVNSAAYANGRVFFGSTDQHVYAIQAGNGSFVWSYKTGSTVKTAPLVADGKVFMGSSDGYMYALNQNDGSLAWRTNIGAPIYDTAAYDNGKVFFGGMDSIGYGLDAGNGNILWQKPIPGQGFRDRWTVAGNGKVFFTPMLDMNHQRPLGAGTSLFYKTANPVIYNKDWATQRQAILNHLDDNPYYQPIHVLEQNNGQTSFIPPVLYGSGGSMSSHAQPVLLPNGNANVIYRRSFGYAAQFGQTTNDALFTGELNLKTGDIIQVDTCKKGSGGWSDCGQYTSPFTSDESAALMRSGNLIYLDIARRTAALDTVNKKLVAVTRYNNTSGGLGRAAGNELVFYPGHEEWIFDKSSGDINGEVASDGNDLKRPTPIVGDVLYVFHYNTFVAVKGTIQ